MSFRSHLQIAEVRESKSTKKDKNVLKLAILILLHLEIPQDILTSSFSFNHKNSNIPSLCGLNFSFV